MVSDPGKTRPAGPDSGEKSLYARLGGAAARGYLWNMGKPLADRAAAKRIPRLRAGPCRQAELLILCARIGYNP
ncbi:MAG: hypothetical protein ACTS10_14070 [Kiloniellales bacterium]